MRLKKINKIIKIIYSNIYESDFGGRISVRGIKLYIDSSC
jgi:hypothetical protein